MRKKGCSAAGRLAVQAWGRISDYTCALPFSQRIKIICIIHDEPSRRPGDLNPDEETLILIRTALGPGNSLSSFVSTGYKSSSGSRRN